MKQWRYGIIALLKKHRETLQLPSERQTDCVMDAFLKQAYERHWHVWASEPTAHHKRNINYLGRYLKRPLLALSRIQYADKHKVVFKYYDHKEKTHRRFVCTPDAFTERLLQHVPEKGFQMIRYFGFLANRVRSKELPKVSRPLISHLRSPSR